MAAPEDGEALERLADELSAERAARERAEREAQGHARALELLEQRDDSYEVAMAQVDCTR